MTGLALAWSGHHQLRLYITVKVAQHSHAGQAVSVEVKHCDRAKLTGQVRLTEFCQTVKYSRATSWHLANCYFVTN